jgi:N,N-dimethyltransferase/O-methyltransferase
MAEIEPVTTNEVLGSIDAFFSSVAIGVAIELGLFWLLEEKPLDAAQIAEALAIPQNRCRYWLQLLVRIGLIEQGAAGYALSATARRAIVEAYSQDTWALLAHEARERYPYLVDLALHVREPGSVEDALGLKARAYTAEMSADPDRARRFTRMLYELHQPLADELAGTLDMNTAKRLLDLGGGSGVVSFALVRQNPRLSAVVMDIPNVCVAGREIAAENGLEDRVTYHAGDFVNGDLPAGFDVVLECDVNVYSEALFRKVRAALNPGGRFLIVDQLAPAEGTAPPSRLHWAFKGSLVDPNFTYPTVDEVQEQLGHAGFRSMTCRELAFAQTVGSTFTDGLVLIEANA